MENVLVNYYGKTQLFENVTRVSYHKGCLLYADHIVILQGNEKIRIDLSEISGFKVLQKV